MNQIKTNMELLKVDFWIKSKRFSVNLDPAIVKKLIEDFKSTNTNAIAFETGSDIIAINTSNITEIKFDKEEYAKKLRANLREDNKNE
jgi:hypothetical protein